MPILPRLSDRGETAVSGHIGQWRTYNPLGYARGTRNSARHAVDRVGAGMHWPVSHDRLAFFLLAGRCARPARIFPGGLPLRAAAPGSRGDVRRPLHSFIRLVHTHRRRALASDAQRIQMGEITFRHTGSRVLHCSLIV